MANIQAKAGIKKKGKFHVVHVYALLMIIILICGILSYIIPAGSYQGVEFEGRSIIEDGSFEFISQTPVSLLTLLGALQGGMYQAAKTIFLVFVVGGAIGVLNSTGAIEGGLFRLSQKIKGKEIFIIPIMMILISLMSITIGSSEEFIPLVPIFVSLALSMGFDSTVGVAMITCATSAGFAGSVLNPFNVGIAQSIAELPLYSGAWFRVIMAVALDTVAIAYVMRYAAKVKEMPTSSAMYELDSSRQDMQMDESKIKYGAREKGCIATFIATIAIMIFGILEYSWSLSEIGGLFVGMSIVIAFITKMGVSQYGKNLSDGMASVCNGALIVGMATGILWTLQQGNILDTILYFLASGLINLPSTVSVIGMYVFQCVIKFVIPSASGQAGVTMPIIAPLSDLLGITRQTAVICYQLGNGISNAITPTSGVLMANLGLAKISWNKWSKWVLPLVLLEYGVGLVFVIIAQVIQLGPF
jgi:uncharacterized ion transporter superfamily protein YfcC